MTVEHNSPHLVGPRPWRVAMSGRDSAEPGRAATPLELLFDLTFVVAVAILAAELAHSIAENHALESIPGYLLVFFAIWWAWMNFSWFASAYDTDDVPYRLLTLVQMGGVLVLAAGVPVAFENQDLAVITYGYVIMRVAMVTQWLRAAAGDPAHRVTCLRYAAATTVVQVGWLVRLWFLESWGAAGVLVLVAADVLIPYWAERGRETSWHPHHIAERYGLFTIIVLGECVLAANAAVKATLTEAGASVDLVVVGTGALLILFALWWIYFLKPAAAGLERRHDLSFLWGYGHYGVFASLAALGAGLEVAAETLAHHIEAPETVVAAAVATPIVVFLVLMWALHAPLTGDRLGHSVEVGVAAATTGLIAAATSWGLPLPWAVLGMSLPLAALVASGVIEGHREHVRAPNA